MRTRCRSMILSNSKQASTLEGPTPYKPHINSSINLLVLFCSIDPCLEPFLSRKMAHEEFETSIFDFGFDSHFLCPWQQCDQIGLFMKGLDV